MLSKKQVGPAHDHQVAVARLHWYSAVGIVVDQPGFARMTASCGTMREEFSSAPAASRRKAAALPAGELASASMCVTTVSVLRLRSLSTRC